MDSPRGTNTDAPAFSLHSQSSYTCSQLSSDVVSCRVRNGMDRTKRLRDQVDDDPKITRSPFRRSPATGKHRTVLLRKQQITR